MSNRQALLAIVLGAAALFTAIFFALPVLYDTDSYYHLAVARAYTQTFPLDFMPWARFSLMFEGFGDKEPLFHLLIAPLTPLGTAGGRLALVLLNTALVAALAWAGLRALGRWGLILPLIVYAGSLDFFGRAIRLRPELLGLLLLLLTIFLVARERYRLVGLVGAAYTLAYTAFQAWLGLCFLFFVSEILRRRRWTWSLPIYATLGVGLGLIAHPNFPTNLLIWKVQNFDFFAMKAQLDVGREIGAAPADLLLKNNLWWLLALAILWRAAGKTSTTDSADQNELDRLADLIWIATICFGGLFVLMQRFSTYAIPLAALALAFEIKRRGLSIGKRTRVFGDLSLPTTIVLGVVLCLGLVATGRQIANLAQDGSELTRENEWAAFGRAVPPGAKVVAEWGSADLYTYWAPQASYLNLLDPIFMALPYPQEYHIQRRLFAGQEPDPALAVARDLDSEFIAFSRYHPAQSLIHQLDQDPRFEALYRGHTLLYRLAPARNQDFLLDWRVVPSDRPLPPTAMDHATFLPWPRADERLRTLEAFVDLRLLAAHLDQQSCATFSHDFGAATPSAQTFEILPTGRLTRLWVDGELKVALGRGLEPVLGSGLIVPVAAGARQIVVSTCLEGGQGGFYLRRVSGL